MITTLESIKNDYNATATTTATTTAATITMNGMNDDPMKQQLMQLQRNNVI